MYYSYNHIHPNIVDISGALFTLRIQFMSILKLYVKRALEMSTIFGLVTVHQQFPTLESRPVSFKMVEYIASR